MDKYTIEQYIFNDSTFDIYKNEKYYLTIHHKEKAELVCRLLNENEERKNQPKINNIHKRDIIRFLIILAEMQNSTEYLKTAKIIDSLEADDGK